MSCSSLGPTICSRCRSAWNPHIFRHSIDGLTIYSSIRYSPTAQKIILGAKESGFKACDDLMIEALKSSLQFFIRDFGDGVLVPIPSRNSARRKRARDFMCELTKQLNHPYSQILEIEKFARDQSRLNHQQRIANLAGVFIAGIDTAIDVTRGEVILIDDVVTTGSTLLEAKRALIRRGMVVKGAVTAVMA